MVNTIWKENFLIMCSKLCLNARDSGHFAQLLLICRNYSLQTLCGAPHNVCNDNGIAENLPLNRKYDILFLDIRFNNCDIGIDVAKKLRKAGNTSLIILLTSLHSKAIEGYEIGAYRYIVKPIIKEKMYAVLDEAISSIRSNYRVILVKDMYNTVVVKIQQILYIYSNARKRCLVTLDGEIETWEQLKSIYEKLPQEQFAYAQKGFVVNYKMIKKLNKTGVELVNGENVPISRDMKNEFFANYFEFLGK